jgi:putative ABC transport system permease protein
MMYAKLALRNIKRSARDYVIYFITIILTVMLMYSFLALEFSPDIASMSENMSMLTSGIVALSVLVALISSFIISYAVRFMLGQRKKEFATYELLGMDIGAIQKLFLIENSMIGLIAFVIGLILGTGLSGLLAQVVKKIFDTPHSYQISFSVQAFALSLFFFALMYGVGMIRAVHIIRRKKIVELLYDSRKNETISKQKHSILQLIIVVCSVLFIAIGMGLVRYGLTLQTNAAWGYLIGAVALLLTGVYEIYRNFPAILITFVKSRKNVKYSDCNLFYFGQIGHRIQSCGRMMAITAILLTVSLTTMFVGLVMGAGYKANMEAYYPYDAGVAIDAPLTKDSFDELISLVDDRCSIQKEVVYYLYDTEKYSVETLALTDYNALRSVLGLEKVELPDGEYLVHCDTWTYTEAIKTALKEKSQITLAGIPLENPEGRIFEEAMEQYQMAGTKGYVLVVPDQVVGELPANKIRLVMELENGGVPELRSEIRQYLNSEQWKPKLQEGATLPDHVTMGVTVQSWGVDNSLTGYTSISFCGLYLSVVFILLSCTILAFEQLSALDNSRRSYQIINKIGVSKKMQKKLIYRELSTFFFIPLILPVIVMIILMFGAQNLFGAYILQKGIIPLYGFATIAIFAIIYFAYYETTYYLFKKHMALS